MWKESIFGFWLSVCRTDVNVFNSSIIVYIHSVNIAAVTLRNTPYSV